MSDTQSSTETVASAVAVLTAHGRAGVPSTLIERDWEALWAAERDGEASVHVRTLNLLVPVPAAQLESALRLARQAVLHRPSRAILVVYDRLQTPAAEARDGQTAASAAEVAAGGGELRALASGICRPAQGGIRLCCEEALITASGVPVRQIVQAVRPLLLPDLPTFCWWPGAVPPLAEDQRVWKELAGLAHRRILDSANLSGLGPAQDVNAALAHTLDWLRAALDGGGLVSDLNWARLTRWRELTARLFDAVATRPALARLARVRIECVAGADLAAHMLALLYLGWLSRRLGWRPAKASCQSAAAQLGFVRGDEPIEVELTCGGEPAPDLRRIVLETRGGERFELSRLADGTLEGRAQLAQAQERSARSAASVMIRPAPADADLLIAELGLLERDVIYEESVRAAASLVCRDA